MVYFTSDLHFGHNKDFLFGPRGFETIAAHNQAIVDNYNSLVGKDDEVYILGDLMLENNEQGLELIKQLNGKIHIILGNHDSFVRIELYKQLPNVVEVTYATLIKIKKQHYYLSHYPTICSNYDDKPYHNHIINLFGHTHQTNCFYGDNPFMYNVSLDAHNNYPVSIEEIDKDIHLKVQELYHKNQKRLKELEAIEKEMFLKENSRLSK